MISTKAEKNRNLVRLFKDNNSVLILVVLAVVAFLLVDGFSNSFYNVVRYVAMYGPVCLGLALVMITGNIDLSLGFQAGLAGVATITVFNLVNGAVGNPVVALIIAVAAAVVVGAVTGFINGFVVAKIGVSPLIATIASNYAFQGLVFYVASSSYGPEENGDIIKVAAQTAIGGFRWLTPAFLCFLVILVIVFFWMYKTRFGNRLHVVGDNPEAASFAGISVHRTVWVTYVLAGILAAVSGFVMVSNAGYAIYTQGNSLATLTVSCCVIGGIKMTGGKGTAIHVLLGVFIMRMISQMMSSMFLPTSLVNLVTGALLIVVLIIDKFTSTKSVEE